MQTLAIVKRFDVFENAEARCFQIRILGMVRPFVLQRPEEPFHHRVVIATACATHRAFDAQRFQRLLISSARILATTIAVMQELVADRPTRFNRAPQLPIKRFRGGPSQLGWTPTVDFN